MNDPGNGAHGRCRADVCSLRESRSAVELRGRVRAVWGSHPPWPFCKRLRSLVRQRPCHVWRRPCTRASLRSARYMARHEPCSAAVTPRRSGSWRKRPVLPRQRREGVLFSRQVRRADYPPLFRIISRRGTGPSARRNATCRPARRRAEGPRIRMHSVWVRECLVETRHPPSLKLRGTDGASLPPRLTRMNDGGGCRSRTCKLHRLPVSSGAGLPPAQTLRPGAELARFAL